MNGMIAYLRFWLSVLLLRVWPFPHRLLFYFHFHFCSISLFHLRIFVFGMVVFLWFQEHEWDDRMLNEFHFEHDRVHRNIVCICLLILSDHVECLVNVFLFRIIVHYEIDYSSELNVIHRLIFLQWKSIDEEEKWFDQRRTNFFSQCFDF